MPKVSIIIPAYNAMIYLPKTLESVLRQTFTDFEVLIVNDGSSDQIVQWAAQLTDPRVKLISQENQGASVARNTGLANAQGDYVAFLDADDLWAATKLEKQTHYLDSHPDVGLVYTWTALIDEQDQPTGIVWASQVEGRVWEHLVVIDGMLANGSVAMVRRCCFEQVGIFDPDLECYEDKDMWVRIATQYPFGVIQEVLNFYRQRPHSQSKNRQKMLQDYRKYLEKTFAVAPLELLYLRNRCYGYMGLHQAWESLELGDYQEASHFRRQALLHYPQLLFSKHLILLTCAIVLTRWLGSSGYSSVKAVSATLHSWRQLLLGIKSYQLIPS
jgi:glycosyltransferase involved in cell wall biosynthesis